MKPEIIYTAVEINCGVLYDIVSFTDIEKARIACQRRIKTQGVNVSIKYFKNLGDAWSNGDIDIFITENKLYQ